MLKRMVDGIRIRDHRHLPKSDGVERFTRLVSTKVRNELTEGMALAESKILQVVASASHPTAGLSQKQMPLCNGYG